MSRALASLLLLAGACSPPTVLAADASRPNVLWIVVDSLRADHLGCYGHARETSPAVDALAREGLLFEQAHSTSSWTMPSIASMLTGMYPGSHGVVGAKRLPSEIETLPEILSDHGYRTAAVVSNYLIGAHYGFAQGFDVFHEDDVGDRHLAHRNISTPGVTEKATRLVGELAGEGVPFFLFLHYFDPHYDYRIHKGIDFAPKHAGSLNGLEPIWKLREKLDTLTETEIAFLDARYDEEIRFTDDGIAEVLAALERSGVARNTLVVFTADHGEEFLAHGWIGHTTTLYEELVRVPLIVRGPGIEAGGRIRQPVSTVSLAPTILELCGIQDPPESFQGESFATLVRGEAPDMSALVFAEVDYEDKRGDLKDAFKKAVIGARWKLVRDDPTDRFELFDLVEDPDEQRDVAAEHPEIVIRLRSALEEHLRAVAAAAHEAGDAALSIEELEGLRNLGYIGPGEEDGDR